MERNYLNRCYDYFLTAVSDLRRIESTGKPEAFEFEQITYEFQANVEAGPSGNMLAKVIVIGHPSESLMVAVTRRKRFQAKLSPNEDRTFNLCLRN